MTITATIPKKSYIATGATGDFVYDFKISDAADLLVYADGSLLVVGVSVSGVGSEFGGIATITPVPVAGTHILLVRSTVRSQATNWTPNDPDPAESKEQAFDKAMSIDQEQDEALTRALKFSVTSGKNNIIVAEPVAGQFLRWMDINGNVDSAVPTPSGTIGLPISFANGGTGASYASREALLKGLFAAQWNKGTDIVAAATIPLPNPITGNYYRITGNTGISAISNTGISLGTLLVLEFSGTPLLTHSANFRLFGGVNYQVVSGDKFLFLYEGGPQWFEFARVPFNPGWITPAFSAGNFTAGGTQTWTVEAGDVTTYAYSRIAPKTMIVTFNIMTSSVGGTPHTELRIAIPGGAIAAKKMENAIVLIDGGGVTSIGFCQVDVSGTTINLLKVPGGNWTGTVNATHVTGQLTFEIQ